MNIAKTNSVIRKLNDSLFKDIGIKGPNYISESSIEVKQKNCDGFMNCCLKVGYLRRQNTQYCDDKRNYAYYCNECQEAADDYWKEMWADLYAGCL